MTGKDQKMNISPNIYACGMKSAFTRACSGKFDKADVLIVSVRHIPFRNADEILSRWNAAEMGYIFNISSENLSVQDYLQKKYLQEEETNE